VRKANEKGIVENAVGYVKHNFLSGRPINQFESLNPAAYSSQFGHPFRFNSATDSSQFGHFRSEATMGVL
jgi:hypothetical protein